MCCSSVESSSPIAGRELFIDDATTSEWSQSVSGLPLDSVLGPLLFFLYTSKIFELVDNKLHAYVVIFVP